VIFKTQIVKKIHKSPSVEVLSNRYCPMIKLCLLEDYFNGSDCALTLIESVLCKFDTIIFMLFTQLCLTNGVAVT